MGWAVMIPSDSALEQDSDYPLSDSALTTQRNCEWSMRYTERHQQRDHECKMSDGLI
jgi:hypothetical protein